MTKTSMLKAIASAAGTLAMSITPVIAYEEKMPEKYYALHYQCADGHKISLTYKDMNDTPSGGYGVDDKMMINGKVYRASYYFNSAQTIINGQTSYPTFSTRGSNLPKGAGILRLNENGRDLSCTKLP